MKAVGRSVLIAPEPLAVVAGNHPTTGAAWRVFRGDATAVLRNLPDNTYGVVVTSPPYYWQRDYRVRGQLGHESTVAGYVDALTTTMTQVRRVLHPRGLLFLNLGDTYYSGKGRPQGKDRKHPGRRQSALRAVDASGLGYPKKTLLGMPWRVALAMIDDGWTLRAAVAWRRPHPAPEPSAKDRPWRTFETVFVFAKTRRYQFSRKPLEVAGEEDVWDIPSQSRAGRDHPAVFPRELVERCLGLATPTVDPALDPFAGSGTVAAVATARGQAADAIDLSSTFCRRAARRLAAGR